MPTIIGQASRGHRLTEHRQTCLLKSCNGVSILPYTHRPPCGPIWVLSRGSCRVINSSDVNAGVRTQRKALDNDEQYADEYFVGEDVPHHKQKPYHCWWTAAVKPAILAGLLLAVSLLATPMAHAARRAKRGATPQVAQESSNRWRSTAENMGWQARQRVLVPAAASLKATGRSIQNAAAKAATATDNRVVKPVVHQAQSAAADTRHFFTHLGDNHRSGERSKGGRSGRSAPGPSTQGGFTLEDHLRDSMQSPAVRIVVTVGAVSVLLLILRTSMEDTIAKKYSPLDSDDWMDREDDNEDGGGTQGGQEYPRTAAAFSGAAAEDAAVLAARASAIVEKGVKAQSGRPAAGRSTAADNGSTPLEIIAPGSRVPPSSGAPSNSKLKAQLEEVRRTVADAKAQVKAATNAEQNLLDNSKKISEQKQLPVFKAAQLQGSPVEYQKKSSTYQSEVQKSAARAQAPKPKAQPIFRYETQDGLPIDGTVPKRQAPVATELFGGKAKRQAAESEEYLRSRGGGAPLVLALGFLSVAASAFAPLVMSKEEREQRAAKAQQRRERRLSRADAEAELDWERYGKYDMLHQLLQSATSEPALQAPRYTPVRSLVDAVPKKGAPRYDFLRDLLRGMTSPSPEAAKYDPVWDLLHAAKEHGLPESSGVRFDPIYSFLNRAAAAADWGLPEEGPVAALLGMDCAGWEPPRYCPVTDVLKSARAGGIAPWHNNARPKWDPVTALFSVEVPQVSSKYDPLKKVVAAEAPEGRGQVDPLGGLLDIFKRKAGLAKADGSAPAPIIPTGQKDPVLAAVAQQHAIPAAATPDQSAAIPTGQSNPLLEAVAQQHAIPAATDSTSGALISRLTEADLQERSRDAPAPAAVQSGWLTAWFRKGAAKAPPAVEAPGAAGSSSGSSGSGAGSISRVGHSLTTNFGRAVGTSAAAAATTPLAELAGERTQPLADALRNAPVAAARAREGMYDPLPDLLRLERGTGTPVMATRDVSGRIGIMLRRDADFDRIVAAFRELAEDGQLSREFRPLFALMRSAAAKPAPAAPVDRSQSILEGLDKGAVAEAKESVAALMEHLSAPKYAPLQRLLSGRRSADVVETACALAAIVQPFDSAALVA